MSFWAGSAIVFVWLVGVFVLSIPRQASLQPQEQKFAKTDRKPFVTSFNPALPKISSVVSKYTTLLQATANCKKAFPNPPVIAYRRNASLRDLLVHSTLSQENSSSQQPAGIWKNATTHAASLVLFYKRVKQTILFLDSNEARKVTDSISSIMDKSSWDTPRKRPVSLNSWVYQCLILTFRPPLPFSMLKPDQSVHEAYCNIE